jgi:protein required for attachment to host cells
MNTTWVLVANAGEARLFETENIEESLHCFKELNHPESREKGSYLASDRPGHYQSKGTGHGAFAEHTDPKDYEAERFAGELAAELEKGRTNNEYKKLVLVAAPHFHGLLNTHLNEHTRALVVNNIQKDFTACDTFELPERLKENIKK